MRISECRHIRISHHDLLQTCSLVDRHQAGGVKQRNEEDDQLTTSRSKNGCRKPWSLNFTKYIYNTKK